MKSALRLENEALELTLLPTQGGRIWEITQKATSDAPKKQWLWHNPQADSCKIAPGASYDDNWVGGWDDLFPNDSEGLWQGLDLPDHGEIWSMPWVVTSKTQNSVTLLCEGRALDYSIEKSITLGKKNSFSVQYRLESRLKKEHDLLFKLHPAFAIEPGDRIELPGFDSGPWIEPVDLTFSSIIGDAQPSKWPYVQNKKGARTDLGLIPHRESPEREFYYVKDLKEGWVQLHAKTGHKLKLTFPLEFFPSFWVFMDWGKWRGYHVVVLEPCTNYPKDLQTAASNGTCLKLKPGQKLEFSVQVEVW